MIRATWNGTTLAESNETLVVEGNHYFPPDAINRAYFHASPQQSFCPWKGTAHYYDVNVNGEVNPGAAWHYPQPKDAAKQIKDYVAFWHGVQVAEVADG